MEALQALTFLRLPQGGISGERMRRTVYADPTIDSFHNTPVELLDVRFMMRGGRYHP